MILISSLLYFLLNARMLKGRKKKPLFACRPEYVRLCPVSISLFWDVFVGLFLHARPSFLLSIVSPAFCATTNVERRRRKRLLKKRNADSKSSRNMALRRRPEHHTHIHTRSTGCFKTLPLCHFFHPGGKKKKERKSRGKSSWLIDLAECRWRWWESTNRPTRRKRDLRLSLSFFLSFLWKGTKKNMFRLITLFESAKNYLKEKTAFCFFWRGDNEKEEERPKERRKEGRKAG